MMRKTLERLDCFDKKGKKHHMGHGTEQGEQVASNPEELEQMFE